MKLHSNARTCPKSRWLLVELGATQQAGRSHQPPRRPASSERTVYRWLKRWRHEGSEGLLDPSGTGARCALRPPAARGLARSKRSARCASCA